MTRLDAFHAPHLVERESQLRRLHQALASARSAHGAVLFVQGEIGTGKTRLLQEFIKSAADEDALCLSGAAFAAEAELPYGVFLTALAPLLRREQPAPPRIAPLAEAFARFAPSISVGRTNPVAPDDAALIWSRLCDAFADFLCRQTERTMLLVLDDLHWADAHSLTLLHFLARQVGDARALIVAGVRSEESQTNPSLRAAALSLSRLGLLDTLSLQPLSIDATQTLIKEILHYDEDLSPAFLELLHGHTEGNPFFLEETLRALAAQGDIYLQGGRWVRRPVRALQVPPTLRDAMLLRLADLSASHRRILECAASIGFEAEYALLRRVCDEGPPVLHAALADVCRLGLLAELQTPALRYRFGHPFLHAAVESSLTEATRRHHHRQIAVALEEIAAEGQPCDWATLVWHTARSDTPDRWRGRGSQLMHAADQAWRDGACHNAARMYEALPALAAEELSADERTLGLVRLGDARVWSGDFGGAVEAWQSGLTGASPKAHRALLLSRIAALRWDEGDEPAAARLLHESTGAAEGDDTGGVTAPSLLALARIFADDGYCAEAEQCCRQALLAGGQEDRSAAEAHAILTQIHEMHGLRDQAARSAAQALAAADETPFCQWEAHRRLAMAADCNGDGEAALGHLDRCHAQQVSQQWPALQAVTDALRGAVLAQRGAWNEARAVLGRAIDAQREMGVWGRLPGTLAEAAAIHRRCGTTIAAHACIDEARAILEEHAIRSAAAAVPVALEEALLCLDERRIEEARGHALHALHLRRCDACIGPERAHTLAILTHVAIAAGDVIAAEQWLASLRRLAVANARPIASGHPVAVARYCDGRGALLQAIARPVEAREAYQRAAAAWSALQRPYEEGTSRLALARLEQASGDADAIANLTRARALLEPLDAEPVLKEVRRLMTALGIAAPRHRTPARGHDLTERERELIGLLAQRRRTDEIADRLVISTATVRTHIRNIFRKLEVSSRGELVLVARGQGLLA